METKRVMISMPEEVYDKLEQDRGSIPRSTYIQDLVVGRRDSKAVDTVVDNSGADLSQAERDLAEVFDDVDGIEQYAGLIAQIKRIEDPDFQADSEDVREVSKLIREAGLSYNRSKRMLWKQDGDKWELIYDFN